MLLENKFLRVKVALRGAELCSLYDKQRCEELIWQGDPTVWGWHAPLLFPLVGKLINDSYRYRGRIYRMLRHGFAREEIFALVEDSPGAHDEEPIRGAKKSEPPEVEEKRSSLHLRLTDHSVTREVYPFRFCLDVIYQLKGRKLSVRLELRNRDEKEMYFTIGAHPGFALPLKEGERSSDYRLVLAGPGEERLFYYLLDPVSGAVDLSHSYQLVKKKEGLALTSELFDKDALIFQQGQISSASILRPNGDLCLTLNCGDFPDFGIWSVQGDSQPFICLEPWFGRSDAAGFAGDLSDRYGEVCLKEGQSFSAGFDILLPES